MTRWDLIDNDHTEDENTEEEERLLKKFNEYLDLERSEKMRKESTKKSHYSKNLKNHFVVLALIEGTILVGLASAFIILLNYQ